MKNPPTYDPNWQLAFFGMGAMGFGLQRSMGPIVANPYPGYRMVQRVFAPNEGGIMVAPQQSLPVSLTGNGATLTGQLALQALANLQNQSN